MSCSCGRGSGEGGGGGGGVGAVSHNSNNQWPHKPFSYLLTCILTQSIRSAQHQKKRDDNFVHVFIPHVDISYHIYDDL